MIVDIYSKIKKIIELIEPYKKIQENLAVKIGDRGLFSAAKEKKKNNTDKTNNQNKGEKASNKKNAESNEPKQKKQKIKEKADQNKGSKNNEYKTTENGNVLNNFLENIKNFYTVKNDFFNFNTKHTNFSYTLPDNKEDTGKTKINNKTSSDQNITKITNKINESKSILNKTSLNISNFSAKEENNNFNEFGKMLAEALKIAARNKSISNKY